MLVGFGKILGVKMNSKENYKKVISFLILLFLLITFNYKDIEQKLSETRMGENTQNSEMNIKAGNSRKREENILVSNLTDMGSKEDLKRLMLESGIDKNRQKQLLSHIDQYNNMPESKKLIGKYKYLKRDGLEFDEFKFQEAWNRSYPELTGYNCRITSMSLLADFIHFDNLNLKPKNSESEELNLAIDLDSLKKDPSAFTKSMDMEKFKALYASIRVDNTKNPNIMKESLSKYLKSVGFKYNNDKASLVTVHFHTHFSEDENELFVGHTGVLFEGENGKYFIEKLAFQAPYRLVKVKNREELKDYLIDKYSSLKGPDEASPFVAINGEPMN